MIKNFSQTLYQILDVGQPFSHSLLQALSNPLPEDLCVFRRGWPAAVLERRRQVARALVQLAEDSPDLYFRDVFLLCLDDADEIVRAAAIDGLSDDESYDFLEHLLVMVVQESSLPVRCQVILALGKFLYRIETTDLLSTYREQLVSVLLDIYHDAQAPLEARRRALESVAYAADSELVEAAIAQAYGTPDSKMRASAVHAMGHHMAACWQPHIERELVSPDAEMRYEAAHACGELADEVLLPQLVPLLEDDDHEVVREAIWALGEIGGQEARRLLQRCLRHQDEDIRTAAEEALHILDFYADPGQVLF